MPETQLIPSMVTVGSIVKVKIKTELVDARYVGWGPTYNMPNVTIVGGSDTPLPRRIRTVDGDNIPNSQIEGAPASSEPASSDLVLDRTTGSSTTVAQVAAAEAAIVAPVATIASEFGVDERFKFIERMVIMVARGKATSLIITGSGGLGKTHTVFSTLAECDLVESEDYVVVRGYSTSRAVFNALKEHRTKIIVFDDCDSVLDDVVSVNLLKGALDTTKRRTVSWLTADDSDRAFDFEGHVIFVSNKELSDVPQALLSRAMFVDVTMTPDEKIERLRTIVRHIRPEVEMEVKTEIIDLMESLKTRIDDLNIRTFMKACDCRTGEDDQDWKPMATYLMLTQTAKKKKNRG